MIRKLIVLAGSVLFFAVMAFADGMLILEPLVRYEKRLLPLSVPQYASVKYHRVNVKIADGIASTSIDQVFKNETDQDLEGTYIFPLPEDSAISDFSMTINGKNISGEILEKDKARQIYEDIVRRMKDPGLLEYSGRNMFKARVYPVPKHGETRMQLVYHQTVKYDAGMYEYVYPLNTEKFSPKPLEEVTVSVDLKSNAPLKTLYSPTHDIDKKIEKYSARCSFEAKDTKPDKDFILYYTVSEKDIGLNLICSKKHGENGYFAMLLSPGQIDGRRIDKNIVFVLDTSGSMAGQKLDQAKEALSFCIKNLGKGDRFNVLSFATGITTFKDTLVESSPENIPQALDFIKEFNARGGTNINDALLSAASMFKNADRPCMIVFLTDGQPTIGETDLKTILKNISEANRGKSRIFVFGVGDDVNTHLLDKLAQDNKGVSDYVTQGENIEVKLSSFYGKISDPVLSNISINCSGIKLKDIYPMTLPDLFKGCQLILFGRYSGSGASEIILKGDVNGIEKQFVFEGTFPEENSKGGFVPRLWATRKIGYLISEIRLKGENKELTDEVIALSKEFGIMTPYTSFLVTENKKDAGRWEIPAGEVNRGKEFGYAMKSLSGKDAVASAVEIKTLKENAFDQKENIGYIKHAGDKTFYLNDNVWIDAKFTEGMKVIQLKYMDSKYLQLLKEKYALGKYFALSKNIIVVFENNCYIVTE